MLPARVSIRTTATSTILAWALYSLSSLQKRAKIFECRAAQSSQASSEQQNRTETVIVLSLEVDRVLYSSGMEGDRHGWLEVLQPRVHV